MTSHVDKTYILQFAEMVSQWGFSRSVGQVFALILFSPTPLNAQHIMHALAISRSNVSLALKELQAWRLIKLQPLVGERSDYFQANGNIWELTRIIVEERQRREITPRLALLETQIQSLSEDDDEQHARRILQDTHSLFSLLTHLNGSLTELSTEQLKRLAELDGGADKLTHAKQRIFSGSNAAPSTDSNMDNGAEHA